MPLSIEYWEKFDRIKNIHSFDSRGGIFTTTLICKCGYEKKVWHGMIYPAMYQLQQLDHWLNMMNKPILSVLPYNFKSETG